MLRITGIVLACLFFIAPAEARHRHAHHGAHQHRVHHVQHRKHRAAQPAILAANGWWQQPSLFHTTPATSTRVQTTRYDSNIVEHPAGCPRVAFCGCGAAVRLGLGASARSLWLAANWYRFPRTSPAPGTVAVSRHHVMVLEADMGGGIWRVYDANSGGHATRIHARSIAGYTIVQPRG